MIIFKTFKIGQKKYLYDRSTNKTICIGDKDYEQFKHAEEFGENIEEIMDIHPYRQKGLLLENSVKSINHPTLGLVKDYLEKKTEQCILQVTQQCNLRCSYCVYSGNYYNRAHDSLIMEEDTAFSAIDYFIEHSSDLDEIVLGFYGGEPLLNFNLIKKSVNYLKEKVKNRKVRFSMTTNGTLFSKEINNFLEKNDFNIMVSLDGTKDEHNKNRCFSDGRGSFDIIMNNIREIQEEFPELYKKISFNTVLNPNHDYEKVKSFFEKTDSIKEATVYTNVVESSNSKKEVIFEKDFYIIRRYDYLMFLLSLIGKVNPDFTSKLVTQSKIELDSKYKEMCLFGGFPSEYHHSGPCIPGSRRLFVSVNGNFYPCERVSETSDIMNIGSLKDGIDIEKCKFLMNIGKITEEECKKCWALFFCSMCVAEIDKNGRLSKYAKCKSCRVNKLIALNLLKEITLLKEYNYDFGLEEN